MMIDHHTETCAIHDEGPCTCGTEEELEALALEEANIGGNIDDDE